MAASYRDGLYTIKPITGKGLRFITTFEISEGTGILLEARMLERVLPVRSRRFLESRFLWPVELPTWLHGCIVSTDTGEQTDLRRA